MNLKGLGNNSLLSSKRWTGKVSKSRRNHSASSFIRKRCVVRSRNQGSPELIFTVKAPIELTESGSDPEWKQFIFWLQVSLTAEQCFTCALLFGISSVYLVLSLQQGAGIHSGSSTFLSSLGHKPLSAPGHKTHSSRSLVLRRQKRLLSAQTGHLKTAHVDLG